MKKMKLYNSISQQTAVAGWVYYTFELLFLPGLLLTLAGMLGVGDAVVNFVYYLLNFVCVLSIFREFLAGSLEQAAKRFWPFLRAIVLGAAVCWAVNQGMSLLMERISPDFANVNDASVTAMVAEQPILMGIGTILLVPLAEECLFRGLVFSQLRPVNRAAAYAVSVLAFCAVHVVGYVGVYPTATLALCFLQYIPSGLILAWSYEHCGSIIAPVLVHTAINAIAVLGVV